MFPSSLSGRLLGLWDVGCGCAKVGYVCSDMGVNPESDDESVRG